MTIKEKNPLSPDVLSFRGSEITRHSFPGEDKEGNPIEEEYLVIQQEAMEILIDQLEEKIRKSGVKFDVTITLVRGGMVPARKTVDILDVPTVAIGIGSRYDTNENRIPPVIYQELPDKKQLEIALRLLGKLPEGKEIETVLIIDEVLDKADSQKRAEEHVEKKWGITRASGKLKTAAVSAKDKGLQNSVCDYYVFRTNLWIIHDWEKYETFVDLFHKWKGYKHPLSDDKIKTQFKELGYSEEHIERFGENLFKE